MIGSIGRRFRGPGRPNPVDAILGAGGAVVVSALVLGVLAAAIKPIAPPAWVRTIDSSVSLGVIGRAMPEEAARQAAERAAGADAGGPAIVSILLTRGAPRRRRPWRRRSPCAGATRTRDLSACRLVHHTDTRSAVRSRLASGKA